MEVNEYNMYHNICLISSLNIRLSLYSLAWMTRIISENVMACKKVSLDRRPSLQLECLDTTQSTYIAYKREPGHPRCDWCLPDTLATCWAAESGTRWNQSQRQFLICQCSPSWWFFQCQTNSLSKEEQKNCGLMSLINIGGYISKVLFE